MPRFVGIIWSHSWLMYQFVWLKSLFSLCLYSDHPFTRQSRQGLAVMSSLSLPDIVNVCVFIYDLRSILIISRRGLIIPIKLFQLRHLLLKHLYPARKMDVYVCQRIDVNTSYDFPIGFLNCSDNLVFFCFYCFE